jgi:hypothetical protein
MKIDMMQVGGAAVLAGVNNGKATFVRLLDRVADEPDSPQPIFLDFEGVNVATASFLRESCIALRNVIRGRDSFYYPVFANVNDSIRDELLELAHTRGEVFLSCRVTKDGKASHAVLVGDLEAKQRLTFDLVKQHGETDAGELMRKYGKRERTQHTTAWNNRLSALSRLGLIAEVRIGRLKRYRPLLEGVE